MVRRKEFAYLRKVRAMSGKGGITAGRPSVFQSSSSFRNEEVLSEARASTLQKINAIEAHMAESWVKGKHADRRSIPRPPGAAAPMARQVPTLNQVVRAPQAKSKAKAEPIHVPPPSGDEDLDMDLDFTGMLSAQVPLEAEAVPDEAQPTVPPTLESELPALVSNAEPSVAPVARRGLPVLLDLENPVLQEAAIRFAESDYTAAGAALLAVTQDPQSDPSLAENCTCALLDIYRAADLPGQFDALAIDYAERFGRSAPEWFSVPEVLEGATPSIDSDLAPLEFPVAGWTCPETLEASDVARLVASQPGRAERHVHWEPLHGITLDGARALSAVFTQWAAQPLALTFGGAEVLNAVLQAATPEQDRSVDAVWWHLRLEALRIQGAQESYENVALDYCMTYEVSPPSWLEANCTYAVSQDVLQHAQADAGPITEASGLGELRAPQALELTGYLLTDATRVLDRMLEQLPPGEHMTIYCGRLIRVDFSAAGSVLNWLTAHQTEGLQIHFVHVPRLVAALFHSMGITEYADVSVLKK
jgi:ABC-type transporter Mla MlaB component